MVNSDVAVNGDDGYKNTCGAALIGKAENGAVVINCGVINSSISVASTSRAKTAGGGLIGRVSGNNVCVKGCYVVGTQIVGKDSWNNGASVGGLIGQLGEGTTSITGLNITSCYTKDVDISGNNNCYIGTFIGSAYYLDTYSTPSKITACYYDASGAYTAIGRINDDYSFTTSIFNALSDKNLANAITNMNLYLTDCDYKFGEDGFFVKQQ